VKAIVSPVPPVAAIDDHLELVCKSGHRSGHSRARVTRLNDAWCGKCGADISYDPLAAAAVATAGAGTPGWTPTNI
jgi:hypothetical protein